MTRYVSSTNQTEGAKASLCPVIAVDLDFASGHVRAHSLLGPLTIGADTYTGVGTLGGIEFDDETTQVAARGFTLTITGESSLIATARDEIYQGRRAVVYIGYFNLDSGTLVDTPELHEDGVMDQMLVRLGPSQGSIELICESKMRSPAVPARYTDADQQARYPGDLFFNLIGKIQGFQGTWGTKGVANDLSGYQPPSVTGPYSRGNMPGRNP